ACLPRARREAVAGAPGRTVRHPFPGHARADETRGSGARHRHGRGSRPYSNARGTRGPVGDKAAAGEVGVSAVPRILHLHSTFDAGGKELRCVRLINSFGGKAHHAIVSGDPERRSATALIRQGMHVTWPKFPSLAGKPLPGRLKRLAAAMAGYDLICTYNWGAMDAALAHTLFADAFKLAPLVHHED